MLDDFNESGDESSSDGEGSSGDEDFVNADGSEDASSGDDESDEAQESGEEDDDMVAMQEALRKNIKQKARVAVQQAGPIAAANGMVRPSDCMWSGRIGNHGDQCTAWRCGQCQGSCFATVRRACQCVICSDPFG